MKLDVNEPDDRPPRVAGGGEGVLEPPGLIWARDFAEGVGHPVEAVDHAVDGSTPGGFRWLHLSLADRRVQRWLAGCAFLPAGVRELLLSPETHSRGLVEQDFVACVLPDLERDFDRTTGRTGVLRCAVGPSLVITARLHPVSSADIVKRRIDRGAQLDGPAAAFELMAGAIAEVIGAAGGDIHLAIQAAEDALLEEDRSPDARSLASVRRRTVLLHRQIEGVRQVFRRLEDDEEDAAVPEPIRLVVAKLSQRFASQHDDVTAMQGQLRSMLDELDLQQTQRLNQNLYILSILTALMLPATLVTGFFGMNTGGLPLEKGAGGTVWAGVLAVVASFGVYVLLRLLGFFRR